MRKKIPAFILIFLFVLSPIVTPFASNSISGNNAQLQTLLQDDYTDYSQDDLAMLQPVEDFNYEFGAPSPQWLKMTGGDAPAFFSQVNYELADDVLNITGYNSIVEHIASEGQLLSGSINKNPDTLSLIQSGAYVPVGILNDMAAKQGRTVEIGTVVVDSISGTAFKVVAPTHHTGIFQESKELQNIVAPLQNTYSITQPQLHEVLKDFSLGGTDGETIELTRGNISGFAPNIEASIVQDAGKPKFMSQEDQYNGYKHIFGEKLVDLKFDGDVLDAQLSGGAIIKITVSGAIGIEKIDVNAKYTKFSGYKFAVTLKQESYLQVKMSSEINKEIRIPIFGIDAGIGDIGRVTGGVFIIVGIDGSLSLEISAREFTKTTIGIRGGTFAFIPTSIRPLYSQAMKGNGDVKLNGEVNGYIKFGPMLGLKLFGLKLVGAGAFLGTGVHVQAHDIDLNIELYGILNLYVDFLGKHFNLIHLQPTIWERKQRNTAGHLITFMETYVDPGRVSGTIQKEVGGVYKLVPNMPYRIWVVPKGRSFNPSNSADLNNPSIRKYPANGYAKTTAEGVFFQPNKDILSGGDSAIVEFQVDGKSYFSNPAEATLPFENFIVTQADYFGDFVIGQVQPIKVINWNVPPDDPKRYSLEYYKNSQVLVRNPLYYNHLNGHYSLLNSGGYSYARTDAFGNFDTRNIFFDGKGNEEPDWHFDLCADLPSHENCEYRIALFLDHKGATISKEIPYSSTIELNYSRVVYEVPNSYKRFEENGKLIDQMAYDEYIFVINPYTTHAVTEEEFGYWSEPFSTQDYHAGLTDYRYVPISDREMLGIKGSPNYDYTNKKKKLIPVNDAEGNPTGAVLFSQRVFVEWVWQAHPNPVKIISADHCTIKNPDDSYQVKATGYAPFNFYLIDAPTEVNIDSDTGLLTIAKNAPAATYKFTVCARENREAYITRLPGGMVWDSSSESGHYDGHDPSPPDEQPFTLTISEPLIKHEPTKESVISTSPSPSPTPFTKPSAIPTPSVRPLPSPTPFAKPSPTPTPSAKPSALPTPFAKPSPTPTPSVKPSTTPTPFAKPSPTPIPPVSPSPTPITRKVPMIAAARHGYAFAMISGGRSLSVQITAAGSSPIDWSLSPDARYPFPSSAYIDPKTGLLTIGPDISAGDYRFVIQAQNDVGQDTQVCSLQVTEPLIAPVIKEESHEYKFKTLKKKEDITIPIYASGSQPITWALENTGRIPISGSISIDPQTGVLTIKTNTISTGFHYFTIRATNNTGTDLQECTLEVLFNPLLSLQSGTILRPNDHNKLQYLSNSSGKTIDFFTESPVVDNPIGGQFFYSNSQFIGDQLTNQYFSSDILSKVDITQPVNTLNIRYDDPNDIYTKDRWTKNGAEFVRWQSCPAILQRYVHMGSLIWSAGTGTMLLDASPRCDNYHYQKPTPPSIGENKEFYQEKILALQHEETFLGDRFDRNKITSSIDSLTRQKSSLVTYLDYGKTIDKLNQMQNGNLEVTLDKFTGAAVTGKFFTALQGKNQTALTFKQDGASITFAGGDIGHTAEHYLYDFSFFSGAYHEGEMLDLLDSKEQHFTFGFAESNGFPGMATFSIVTSFTQGTQVNVYRYDEKEKSFSLIAANVSIGENGVATYLNKTMSEYLITTQTIRGASVSEVADLQSFAKKHFSWYWPIGIGVLLLAVVFFSLWWLRKRKHNS